MRKKVVQVAFGLVAASTLALGVPVMSSADAVGGKRTVPARASDYSPVIDPAEFVREVDNPYFPLTPGTLRIYEGQSEEGTVRVRVLVTRKAVTILGVRCVVVLDTVSVGGQPIEKTYDWYAQDERGNVWYFGENSRDFKKGKWVVSDGSWKAGVDGAKPGIVMKAHPRKGDRYRQEYYEGHAEDMAKVGGIATSVSVPYGTFERVLVTREWTPLEPSVAEKKYYAPGIGEIRTVMVRGGSDETQLVEIRTP